MTKSWKCADKGFKGCIKVLARFGAADLTYVVIFEFEYWCYNYLFSFSFLLQAGAQVNAQDFDGWTSLHAASHWGQREACEILCENYANMDIKNFVGQTCFDVADPDVLTLLDELKRKQATLQRDRPDIRSLINRPAVPASEISNVPTSATAKRRFVNDICGCL